MRLFRRRFAHVKVHSLDGITPVVHADAWVHPNAVLSGGVHAGAGIAAGGMVPALK